VCSYLHPVALIIAIKFFYKIKTDGNVPRLFRRCGIESTRDYDKTLDFAGAFTFL
jgi:hypothetical protein